MSESLSLVCPSARALSELLQRAGPTNTLLLPAESGSPVPAPFERRALHIELPGDRLETACEVLQLLPSAGTVVRLLDPTSVHQFVQQMNRRAETAEDEGGDGAGEAPAGDAADTAASRPRRISAEVQLSGTTPLSWPIERLRTDWHALGQTDRIRIARHGKRPARNLVLQSNDKKLMVFLLQNSHITADEIAVMAAMPGLDPDLLRRIAASSEWTRHTAVARNLVCNPKLPSNLVKKLVDKLPMDELRRLARSGRVRASTKQLIVRKVERGR